MKSYSEWLTLVNLDELPDDPYLLRQVYNKYRQDCLGYALYIQGDYLKRSKRRLKS